MRFGIPLIAALVAMALTYSYLTYLAVGVHETIHQLIFSYFGVEAQVSVNPVSMEGITIPAENYPSPDFARFGALAQSLNEIAYIFLMPINLFVSFGVFASSYFVLADIERKSEAK